MVIDPDQKRGANRREVGQVVDREVDLGGVGAGRLVVPGLHGLDGGDIGAALPAPDLGVAAPAVIGGDQLAAERAQASPLSSDQELRLGLLLIGLILVGHRVAGSLLPRMWGVPAAWRIPSSVRTLAGAGRSGQPRPPGRRMASTWLEGRGHAERRWRTPRLGGSSVRPSQACMPHRSRLR
jgi:hypothetical protein